MDHVGRIAIKIGVMQHRAMRVQGDDIAVRKLSIRVADSFAVGAMDIEFGLAIVKRGFCSEMAAGSSP